MGTVERKRDKGAKKEKKGAGKLPQFSTGGNISQTGFLQKLLICPTRKLCAPKNPNPVIIEDYSFLNVALYTTHFVIEN